MCDYVIIMCDVRRFDTLAHAEHPSTLLGHADICHDVGRKRQQLVTSLRLTLECAVVCIQGFFVH